MGLTSGLFLIGVQILRNQQRVHPKSVHYWTDKDMAPQDGKTFLITGASSGMGYSCAESIAKKGGNIIIAGRSLDRCRTAADMIKVRMHSLRLTPHHA